MVRILLITSLQLTIVISLSFLFKSFCKFSNMPNAELSIIFVSRKPMIIFTEDSSLSLYEYLNFCSAEKLKSPLIEIV